MKMKTPSSTLYVAQSESRGFTRTVRVALHPVPTLHTILITTHVQRYPFRIIWCAKPLSCDRPLDYVEWLPSCLGSGYEAWVRDSTTKYAASFEDAVAWLQGAVWPLGEPGLVR